MLKVSMSGLDVLIDACWKHKKPLFISGGMGIGKSHHIRDKAIEKAKEAGREFLDWADATEDLILNAIANPEKYFVFCDQRVAQKDPTDLQGIFNLIDKEMLSYIPHSWGKYFTRIGAAGFLFLDELTLAAPVVAGAAYQIIHDRVISDRRFSKNVWICAAGNRTCDKAHVFEMPLPLEDRFVMCELQVDADAWKDWAIDNKVNSHLISFISWKPSYIYHINDKRTDKSSTPRGITRVSEMVAGMEIESADVHMLMEANVGEAFANEFQAYVKLYQKLDWKKIFDDPKSVCGFEVDKKYALVGGMVELFNKTADQTTFDNIMSVLMHIDEDYAIITLRMVISYKKTEYRRCMKKTKHQDTFIQKYAKFFVED